MQVADTLGAQHRVITGDALLAENYPTIHAVGRASTRAPRLVDIRWGDEAVPKVTLGGEGVGFDTGGLDLKTQDGMYSMKTDMGGGAAVLGAMYAIAQVKPNVRVIGIMTAAENMPSGTAMRPSDVVTALNGKTFEIGHTDAEGRRGLADAGRVARGTGPALGVRDTFCVLTE